MPRKDRRKGEEEKKRRQIYVPTGNRRCLGKMFGWLFYFIFQGFFHVTFSLEERETFWFYPELLVGDEVEAYMLRCWSRR